MQHPDLRLLIVLNETFKFQHPVLLVLYAINQCNGMSMMHGFCCNCWFVENSAMVSGCFSNILSYCWWKRNSKPQTTARNVMRFPLKPYPWDILTIINCYNCRISATSPHTAWLMNTFHSEAKMVRTKCHPIPPWNMRFIFSKHHGLRHDDFEGLGCFSEVLESFSEDRRGYLVIHGRGWSVTYMQNVPMWPRVSYDQCITSLKGHVRTTNVGLFVLYADCKSLANHSAS